MNELPACLLSLALAFAGMAALAFAMERHYEQLTGARALPAQRHWHGGGRHHPGGGTDQD